ncbi:MAG: rhamnogalacturonan lyase [Treponema sp.]|nr:rhamnogalacturonan lyase [Treponema sp.]
MRNSRIFSLCLAAVLAAAAAIPAAAEKRQMEALNRGLAAVSTRKGVFLSWRLLGNDSKDVAFHVYQNGSRITSEPLTGATCYVVPKGKPGDSFAVSAVTAAGEEEPCAAVQPFAKKKPYISIPINQPKGGKVAGVPDKSGKVGPEVTYSYNANDASCGDLDGDGEYEIILKWDPDNSKDNSQSGYTGQVFLDAYKLDGTQLWRIDLGKNIRAGAHYTQFLVYDYDGDGKAEVVLKTADGTVDGTGAVIGDKDADWRESTWGKVLNGPEYLTVFEGATGKALESIPFVAERGSVDSWGDGYGNRCDRFLCGTAYLDGVHPSIIEGRGYYAKTTITAYDWRDGKLSVRWAFSAARDNLPDYMGQGNHSLSVCDVDGDGYDEIVYGSITIDHDGKPMYSTKLGHGDALHVSDLDPTRPGMEVFDIHEDKRASYNAEVHDAATGEILAGAHVGAFDCGRGVAADVDPRYPGAEWWASRVGMYTIKGEQISDEGHTPPMNFAIWWDGDLLRELNDDTTITKWDYKNATGKILLSTAMDCLSNNGSKANCALQADLFGDWREEVIWRSFNNKELRIYMTTDTTEYRIPTLMHDSQYRVSVSAQNSAYNQPPHTSYFLGEGMTLPVPQPEIYLAGDESQR